MLDERTLAAMDRDQLLRYVVAGMVGKRLMYKGLGCIGIVAWHPGRGSRFSLVLPFPNDRGGHSLGHCN